MSDIKVTQTEIDLLLNSADVQVRTEFGKCTVVTVRLRNGFILTESSACVDPANYDAELGKRLCLQHIENRLWELEGYALQKRTDEERTMECAAADTETRDFGWALSKLRCGWPVRRRGWNGKNQYVELAERISYENAAHEVINANHEAIGNKALAFVGTSGVQLGWLASQADMLAEDWEIAEVRHG